MSSAASTAATQSLNTAILTNQVAPGHDERGPKESRNVPRTSAARQRASRGEEPLLISQFVSKVSSSHDQSRTYLYLAYGSNLCAETFQGKRNIKPLSQVNVVVPQLALTFDLAGIPYREPCFGNCRYRESTVVSDHPLEPYDYHKDRWRKGMVGVVYEVTAADYAHIIATEGGGSGYKDIVVDCYPLSEDPMEKVPLLPTTTPFKSHTLFSPPTSRSRPDPSYAQPSARYKKLITDGANEHQLPLEYREFLDNLRTYSITTTRQRLGQALFLSIWTPVILPIFLGLTKLFVRKDGTIPKWLARFINAMFAAIWISYDKFFKPIFGDGERTIGDETDEDHATKGSSTEEKARLLSGPVPDNYHTTMSSV